MKKIIKVIVPLMCFMLVACVTDYRAEKVSDGTWKNLAHIALQSEKISTTEYRIVALGAGASRPEDIVAAWDEFAVKIADGRPYTKESKLEDYVYLESYIRHNAKRLVGKITITAQK